MTIIEHYIVCCFFAFVTSVYVTCDVQLRCTISAIDVAFQ